MLTTDDHASFMDIDLNEVEENISVSFSDDSYELEAFEYLRKWRADVTAALFELITHKAPPLVVMAKVCVVGGLIKPEMIDTAFNQPGLAILIGAQDALVKKAKDEA